jgi:DNA modification methylase
MKIEQRKIEALIPYVNNSRTHSDEQVAQIAASVREFGWTNPILVDGQNGIIAGHGRLAAARKLGLAEVPVIVLDHLSDAQKKALVIADNKLASNAGWDDEMLRLELGDLQEMGFDATLTGFSTDELDALLNVIEGTDGLTDEDDVPEAPEEPTTRLGDVWILGKHRLMCGDSTSIDAVERLMDGQKADMVFTDPPYGISIVGKKGNVGATNLAKAKVYSSILGDQTIDVAIESFQVIKTINAQVEIIWGGNYYANHLENSSCWIVWDKNNTGNFADAELAWTNQKTAVRVFKHTWNGMIKESERNESRVHPTQKPVALAVWSFENYGKDLKIVLDLFGGSGSTLIACEKTARQCRMMELDPKYCDVIVKRWQEFTGKAATHAESGIAFDSMTNTLTQ